MKKFFIFAILLAAGTLAITSCNNKKDEPKSEEEQKQEQQAQGSDIFKGMEFRHDYIDEYNHYNRDYFIFG